MTDIETLPPESGNPEPPADTSVRAALMDAFAELEQPTTDDPSATEQEPAPGRPASEEPAGQRPPSSWRKEAQAAWDALPPAIREEVAKREGEIQAKLTETAAARRLADGLGGYVNQITAAGLDPAQYIGNVLGWAAALHGQPEQALLALSQQYVGDAATARRIVGALSQRFGLDEFGMEPPERPARDTETTAQIHNLQERLRRAEVDAARREWSEFVKANPDADTMRDAIAKEIQANGSLTYAEAYERARWLDPGKRAELLKQETAAKAREAREAARKAVAMSLPRGRSATQPQGTGGTVGESLRATAARIGMKLE